MHRKWKKRTARAAMIKKGVEKKKEDKNKKKRKKRGHLALDLSWFGMCSSQI